MPPGLEQTMKNAAKAIVQQVVVTCSGSIKPSFEIPKGFSIEGGSRKFIVLEQNYGFEIVIGRPLNEGSYYHESMTDKHGLVRGGGEVTLKTNGQKWVAVFGGLSGDFGVFDPRIVGYAEEISKQIGLPIQFEWLG